MRKFFGILLAVIAIAAGILAGYFIYDHLSAYQDANNAYEELADETTTEMENNKKDTFKVDWEKFKGTDVVGWIRFSKKISYPIVQGKNNSQYLRHLYNGEYNICGSIFMNAYNSPYLTDQNTIIFGHNMRNGSMFGTLKKYRSSKYKNKKFYIYLPDGTRHTYQMFAMADVKDGGKSYTYVFDDSFLEYQKYMKSLSIIKTSMEPDENARIVSLSTCSPVGSAQGKRFMIQGMETEIVKLQDAASWYSPPDTDK